MAYIVFRATSAATGSELYVTNGTIDGSALLKDINPGGGNSTPGDFTPLDNGRVLFAATDAASGRELWITDGTAAGTVRLSDIAGGRFSRRQ